MTAPFQATTRGDGTKTQFDFDFVGVSEAYIGVIRKDANGNEVFLKRGDDAAHYQLTLNAAVPGAIWGVGGTVSYSPDGAPLPAGSCLTIFSFLEFVPEPTEGKATRNSAGVAR